MAGPDTNVAEMPVKRRGATVAEKLADILASSAYSVPDFATLGTAFVPKDVKILLVRQYRISNPGIGAACWIRVATQPTHMLRQRSADRYLPNGNVDSTNGGWWEICEDILTPYMVGAYGNGSANDTTPIQQCDDYASIPEFPKRVYFTGKFCVTNISKGNAGWMGSSRRNAIILPHGAANDIRYLVADKSWLTPGSIYGQSGYNIDEMTIDAADARQNAYVIRSYFTNMKGCRIKGSTDTDLLMTTTAADGTLHAPGPGASLVNNTYEDCWFGFASNLTQYNVKQVDPRNIMTDCHMIDCYVSGAAICNVYIVDQSAGWKFDGLHCYGSPISVNIRKIFYGTRIINCYLEGDAHFGSTASTYPPVVIGPTNKFGGNVWADFESNLESPYDQMIFFGNEYGPNAYLRHNWGGGITKELISDSEIFHNAAPFQFYSAGNGADSSSGIMHICNALVKGTPWKISCAFTGPSAAVTTHPRLPTDLFTSPKYASRGTAGWHFKTGSLSVGMEQYKLASANAALTLNVEIPSRANDGGFLVTVFVGQKANHSGAQQTLFKREYLFIKKPGDGQYYGSLVTEVYTGVEWTVAPTLTIGAEANGLVPINFAGTPATTTGYGPAYMKVSGV